MDLSSLRDRAYRDLAEARIGNDRVTVSDLDKAINDIYEEIARVTGCFVDTETVAKSGSYYPIPAKFCTVRAVNVTGSTAALDKTVLTSLSMSWPNWRNASTGTPEYFFLFDHTRLGVYPPTATSVDIEGAVIPVAGDTDFPTLVADTDVPKLMAGYHMALVHGAVAAICGRYLLDNEAAQAKAAEARREYGSILNGMVELYATGVTLASRARTAPPQG